MARLPRHLGHDRARHRSHSTIDERTTQTGDADDAESVAHADIGYDRRLAPSPRQIGEIDDDVFCLVVRTHRADDVRHLGMFVDRESVRSHSHVPAVSGGAKVSEHLRQRTRQTLGDLGRCARVGDQQYR
ncbi:hypothetical protein [Mycolicibacterium frederiksbergense]|uniref:hypothetical protein n=1 Tax=Mycolicibacterium frederiksbergense TaxID=117567 RepID=UPI00344EADC7